MKTLFIKARKKADFNLSIKEMENLEKLPEKIHILYIIQYKDIAEKIKEKLENSRHEILAFQQILGCSKIKPKASLLLIGSGRFHALHMALTTGKEVFIYPGFGRISEEEIKREAGIKKAKLSKFLASEDIGLLVSIKPGQNKLKEAVRIKKKLGIKFPAKKFHIFISNDINTQELENFPCFFVNFACPGLELDSRKIINFRNLLKV